jgi:uncharacterized protein
MSKNEGHDVPIIVRTDLPHIVRVIENAWIPLSDGCRLGARIWLPEDAEQNPVPAILEYIPYRKNDHTAARDAARHAYFAGHGYGCLRVDMRGTGDSDGILMDEYLAQEQDDGLEILAWIASQPWCTGDVGMIGISWGGFNGLQIAARRPSELRAVISVMSTDDRYSDDVHYMGGCMLADDGQLSWASSMLAFNARPPDPAVVGERWREMWLNRMERTPPYIEAWVGHQRRDDFWKHGSVCESFDAIQCPVYMVGGWADGYRDAILRFLAGYSGSRKGLIGPWGHEYPEEGPLGPAFGFLQECLRWWDYWLKGVDTGVMDEPMLRAWMQEWVEPRPQYDERPGRWVAEEAWPSPRIETRSLSLNAGGIDEGSPDEVVLSLTGTLRAGQDAGDWCSFGRFADEPSDQRMEDGASLTFTSAPLEEPLEILGSPKVALTLAADQPRAMIAVRLCDVSPTGSSLLVTRNLLNLAHRDGHEDLAPLEPGARYTVSIPLHSIAHTFPAGHRMRIGVSPDYWPWAWPSPAPATLTVFAGGGSSMQLPVRPPSMADADLPPFELPESAPPLETEWMRVGEQGRKKSHDIATGVHRLDFFEVNEGWRLPSNGIEYDMFSLDTYTVREGEPLTAHARSERQIAIGRGAWQTRVETVSTMSGDAGEFHITNQMDGYDAEVRVFSKSWTFTVPRDHV